MSVWFVEEEASFEDDIQDAVEHTLRESKIILIILSQNSIQSAWVFFELGVALAGNKPVISVAIDDTPQEKFPFLVSKWQYFREKSPVEAGKKLSRLLEALPLEHEAQLNAT